MRDVFDGPIGYMCGRKETMVRTVITIPESDKEWLEKYSRRHEQSLAETVRQAIHCYQEQISGGERSDILRETAGMWRNRGKDGLEYQRELREEWEERV